MALGGVLKTFKELVCADMVMGHHQGGGVEQRHAAIFRDPGRPILREPVFESRQLARNAFGHFKSGARADGRKRTLHFGSGVERDFDPLRRAPSDEGLAQFVSFLAPT